MDPFHIVFMRKKLLSRRTEPFAKKVRSRRFSFIFMRKKLLFRCKYMHYYGFASILYFSWVVHTLHYDISCSRVSSYSFSSHYCEYMLPGSSLMQADQCLSSCNLFISTPHQAKTKPLKYKRPLTVRAGYGHKVLYSSCLLFRFYHNTWMV